jgi:uncharacterized iron-regulated protein
MRRRFAALFVAFALGACASERAARTGGDSAPRATARSAPPPLVPRVAAGTLVRTSRETDFDAMIEELATADVVYVGEAHDNVEHHEIQLRVLEALYARGRLHGVGMEQFQRPFQPALDAYVEGAIDEAELLERTEWKRRWRMDFGLYRPILEFARARRLPVIALNVPDEIRAAVREGNVDALPADQRASLPAPYPDDPEHLQNALDSYRAQHGNPGATAEDDGFRRFYRVMRLWDDYMADSVVRWFRTAPPDAQLVVLAGAGHVANRYGIPARAHRRNGRPYATLVPIAAAHADREASHARRYADFVWITK